MSYKERVHEVEIAYREMWFKYIQTMEART
jgi:hypothetical protein